MKIFIEFTKNEDTDQAILKFNTENENNAIEVLSVLDQTFKNIKMGLDEVFINEGNEAAQKCKMERFQSIMISKDN